MRYRNQAASGFILGFTERPQGSDIDKGYDAMTTLTQEWALIAQDQANATQALVDLCKARLALHRAHDYLAEISAWATESSVMLKIAQYAVRDAGITFTEALYEWLGAVV